MRSRILVALQFLSLALLLVPSPTRVWHAGALLLVVAGVALGGWTITANRPGNFNIRPEPKRGGHLVDTGPYRFVRHPMYLAVVAGALGLVVADPRWWRVLTFAALLLVLLAKATIEEKAMLAMHPGYAAYRARTARILPFLW